MTTVRIIRNGALVDVPYSEIFPELGPIVPPTIPAQPSLFATAGIVIVNGVVVTLEIAPQIASAYYEDGWMTLAFAQLQPDVHYLVFVQTDIPAKIEQFKDLGSFELIFTHPETGDPIEPGRVDLHIIKAVR